MTVIGLLVGLLLAALVYFIAGLFTPDRVALVIALLFLILYFVGGVPLR